MIDRSVYRRNLSLLRRNLSCLSAEFVLFIGGICPYYGGKSPYYKNYFIDYQFITKAEKKHKKSFKMCTKKNLNSFLLNPATIEGKRVMFS